MIALNRAIPKTCLDCPCLNTLFLRDSTVMLRYCRANCTNIFQTTLHEFGENEEARHKWNSCLRPDSCPWIELEDNNDSKTN